MVREMTETNLRSAYAGESQAHMRYVIYAERAEKRGFPNVARLFNAVAFSEKIHASNHYKNIKTKGAATTVSGALFGTRNTSEDLQTGTDGETFEIEEMYPAYKTVANFQGEKAAGISFRWALESEKIHAAWYKKAKKAVDKGKDVELGKLYICPVCGYAVDGEPPDRCPVCNAKKELFRAF